jgi:hypothetical protein
MCDLAGIDTRLVLPLPRKTTASRTDAHADDLADQIRCVLDGLLRDMPAMVRLVDLIRQDRECRPYCMVTDGVLSDREATHDAYFEVDRVEGGTEMLLRGLAQVTVRLGVERTRSDLGEADWEQLCDGLHAVLELTSGE